MLTRHRAAPLLALLLLSRFASAQTSAVSPYVIVLERHGVLPETLGAHRVLLVEGRFYRAGPDGSSEGAAMSPEELDHWLEQPGQSRDALPPQRAPLALPKLNLELGAAALAVPGAFDGARVSPVTPEVAPEPKAPAVEPPFGDSLKPIAKDLWNPKRRGRGLRALSERFQPDPASETGLSDEAPEALRLLSVALHDGKGGPEAPGLLRRMLARVAELQPEQKEAFAARLASPLAVYVILSRSRAPHAVDARLYFRRMTELLDSQGRTVSGLIRESDPSGKYAVSFLLRSHAYDALIPYLNRRPEEAKALAEFLFPDEPMSEARKRASQLEGLMTQLAVQGRRSGALDAFVRGLAERAVIAPAAVGRRVALYLKVNQALLPKRLRPDAEASAGLIPAGLLEDAGLTPSDPQDDWPADQWRFAMHFASTDSYRGWLASFLSLGYQVEPSTGGVEVSKQFGGLKVVVHATLYPGDKEGFLRGEEAKRFLAGVSRDLNDPNVQGVMLRNHAQFRVVNLFGKKVTPGKLLLDGACRSAWDLQELRRRCPSCRFIVNTGTGYGKINNEAVIAVIEGLARGDGWEQIGEDWARRHPRSSARMQGPWTPPFEEALRLLERSEAASAKSVRST